MEPTTINNFVPTEFKEEAPNRIKYNINLNSKEFELVVNDLVLDFDIDEVVETGTFNGLGSTSVFAKTGKYVFTIECNKNNFETAIRNLEQYQNVCVIHGLSLYRDILIKHLMQQEFDINTTYDSDYPKSFYMREINQQVVLENALDVLANNDRKQLVFLDSAGGVGYAEFLEFMNYEGKDKKILVLDDIDHIKHKRSVEYLEQMGYNVNKSVGNRFAWCDLSKGKLRK
jgi:hypothetical protein